MLWSHCPAFLLGYRDSLVGSWQGGFPQRFVHPSPCCALCERPSSISEVSPHTITSLHHTHSRALLLQRQELFGSQTVSGSAKLWLHKATHRLAPPMELKTEGAWIVQTGLKLPQSRQEVKGMRVSPSSPRS